MKKSIGFFILIILFMSLLFSEMNNNTSSLNSSEIMKKSKNANNSVNYSKTGQVIGSPEEARDLVERAIDYYQKHGRKKAYSEFMRKNSIFYYKDLYLFVIDLKGNILVHGGEENLIGTNQYNLKDSFGKFFIKEFIQIMKTQDSGWSKYNWRNYETYKIEPKLTFLRKLDDVCFIGCGAYYNR